jgi:hypothetical protein
MNYAEKAFDIDTTVVTGKQLSLSLLMCLSNKLAVRPRFVKADIR